MEEFADDNIKHTGGGLIAAILDRLAVLLKGDSAESVLESHIKFTKR